MRVRVSYSQEYLEVREKLDPLAILIVESVEDQIADEPEIRHHRRLIPSGEILDFSGGEGDILIRYRRTGPETVRFEKLKDLRNPDL